MYRIVRAAVAVHLQLRRGAGLPDPHDPVSQVGPLVQEAPPEIQIQTQAQVHHVHVVSDPNLNTVRIFRGRYIRIYTILAHFLVNSTCIPSNATGNKL